MSEVSLEERLATIRRQMVSGLVGRADEIEGFVAEIEDGVPERFDELRRAAHKLRGVAASFGFPALGDLAGEVERSAKEQERMALDLGRQLALACRRRHEMESEPPPSTEVTIPERERRLSVLLVDDDETTLKLLALSLGRFGALDIDTTSSGQTALQKALTKRYDVVVTDAMMPGMTGMELVAALADLKQPPACLLVSAAGPAELGAGGSRARWLQKPVPTADLELAIREAHEKQRNR